ncbi:hypothetical protein F5888DRAFT_1803360 [Russula emetica]|nr:hypothetical protein F5888DRAFT_1803360 [Russula emetica]
MSPVQAPVCTTDYPRTRIDAALIRAEFLHPDSFYPGTFLEEEDAAVRKRAETVSQYKLPTYQAAAVVSTVLAGVESQLLVFFKSSPDFTQQPVPVILQYLLVLTYIALIFSVSATINSLILTRNFGNVPMLVGRLQEKIRSVALPTFESPPVQKRSGDDIAPWRWRLLEGHWLFTLVISVLCLPAQILLYIWTQEKIGIRAAVSVAGVFAMLPILHFLPIPRRGMGARGKTRKSNLATLPRYSSWDGPNFNLLPAPVTIPLPSAIYTVRSAYKTSY